MQGGSTETAVKTIEEVEVRYDRRAELHKISALQSPNAESNLREVRINRAMCELEGIRERQLS